jgi:hypothetical protein
MGMQNQTVAGNMLILRRRFCVAVILITALGAVIGCSSVIGLDGPGNAQTSNSDSEDGSDSETAVGPDTEAGDLDPGGGGGLECGSGEPSDSGTENPPDSQPDSPPGPSVEALPDFSMVDVNPDSARYQEAVSPRDYLGRISAWYFGHST